MRGRTCSVWVLTFCYQLAIVGIGLKSEVDAYSGHTSATEDGAEDLGSLGDIDCYVAADGTCREGQSREATTATEDVAVYTRRTECTDKGIALDSGADIAQNVTILTTTEDRAEDDSITTDDDFCRAYIGPAIEEDARVAHAGAEDVTVDRTSLDARNGTGHANGTAPHFYLATT